MRLILQGVVVLLVVGIVVGGSFLWSLGIEKLGFELALPIEIPLVLFLTLLSLVAFAGLAFVMAWVLMREQTQESAEVSEKKLTAGNSTSEASDARFSVIHGGRGDRLSYSLNEHPDANSELRKALGKKPSDFSQEC